jgi:hypothetical protein
LALALAMAAPGAHAQGASTVLGGLRATLFEEHLLATSQICGARFKDTAAAWQEGIARFRGHNAAALAELRELRDQLVATAGKRSPGDAARTLDSLQILQATVPAMILAPELDPSARAICERWLNGLAAGGSEEMRLPHALELARKLQPPAAAGSAPR